MLDLIEDEVRRVAVHEAGHAVAFRMLHDQSIQSIKWTWGYDGLSDAHVQNAGWDVDLGDVHALHSVQEARLDVAVAGGVAEAVFLHLPHGTPQQRRERVADADIRQVLSILTEMSGADEGWEAAVEAAWARVAPRLRQPALTRAVEALAIALSNRRLAMFRLEFELTAPVPDLIIRGSEIAVRFEHYDPNWPASGVVRAMTAEDREVGFVNFHYKSGDGLSHPRLELDVVRVDGDYLDSGLAYRLIEETIALHPDSLTIVSPEGVNEAAGDDFIASLRQQGQMLHDQVCFREGLGCGCALSV